MKERARGIRTVRERGFTMIELVVVLLILTLSAALLTPSLSRFASTVELKAAVKKISGILRYYRSEAVYRGTVFQVLFNPETGEVTVKSVETEEAGGDEPEKEKAVTRSYLLPKGIHIKEIEVTDPEYASDHPAIEFYPNGGSNGGTLLLDAQDRKGFRIKVHFLTGMVEVEQV
jgi:type II secretion system protein H